MSSNARKRNRNDSQTPFADRCANPFGIVNHGRGKLLRKISHNAKKKYPNLPERSKLCANCRHRAYTELREPPTDPSSSTAWNAPASGSSLPIENPNPNVSVLESTGSANSQADRDADSDNENASPRKLRRIERRTNHNSVHYDMISPVRPFSSNRSNVSTSGNFRLNEKSNSTSSQEEEDTESDFEFSRLNVRKTESNQNDSVEINRDEYNAALEILQQLKEKFAVTTKNSEKITILTLAPKSWSIRKLAKEFNTSRQKAQKAKKLVSEYGILTAPNSKRAACLPEITKSLIIKFYEDDENSRIMPGKKDFVSVKGLDGKRHHHQKRLVLCNLKELYQQFKSSNPSTDVGFSKFAELRPAHCVLAGASGTHCVCVCTYHENVKLMLDGANIPALTKNTSPHLQKYEDCLQMTMCEKPEPTCHLGECTECPGNHKIKEFLQTVFDNNSVDEVVFRVWQSTDRCTLSKEVMDSEAFIDCFAEKLDILRTHHYIASQQSAFLKMTKDNLEDGEFIVQCDFAENYAFVAQDAAQAFHWNNDQASIHTAVIYTKSKGELVHHSIVILSDNLHHDVAAVYDFQKLMINFLKEQYSTIKKIIYVTDGAPQHYKNKYQFANLLKHEADFGIPAQWHFHATAHGKGPCDGIGGNLKRQAARASLQRSSATEPILDAQRLYEWAKTNLPLTNVFFVSKETHEATKLQLKSRFDTSKVIPGTKQYHSFIPNQHGQLELRRYSLATDISVYPKKRKI